MRRAKSNRHQPLRLDPAADAQRMDLYRRGLGDRAISRALGLHKDTVRQWRVVRGLPPAGKRNGPLSPDAEAMRRRAHKAGGSDCLAAKVLGLGRETYRVWRHRRGLPVNQRAGRTCPRTMRSLDYVSPYMPGSSPEHDRIADRGWSEWLEEAGATAW